MGSPFALADGVLGPLKAAREASVLEVYKPSQASVVPGRRFEKVAAHSSSLAPGESAGVLPPVTQNSVPAEVMRRVTPRALVAPPNVQAPVVPTRSVSAIMPRASACNTEASAAMDRCFSLPSDFSSLRDFNRIVSRTLARPQPQQMDFTGYGGGVSGTGDVLGPNTSTDNAIARYDGTTGKRIQNSDVIIDDTDPTGTTVHTNEGGPDAPNPLVVRSGNTTLPGESGKTLTLKGGSNNDPGAAAGDVEVFGGSNLAGGPNGQVKIGTTQTDGVTIGAASKTNTLDGLNLIDASADLNTPKLAAQGDTDTGLALLGTDVLALVTNGAYRLAIDDVGVAEHTSGWRGPVFRTSADVTLNNTVNTVIVTGAHAVTLQAAPLGGFEVFVFNAHSAAITVGRNGKNINGAAADLSVPAGKGALLKWDSSGNSWWTIASYNGLTTGTTGDVTGPGSSTDNAVARFDSTTGKLIQNSDITIDDASGGSVKFASTTGNDLAINAADGSGGAGRSLVVRAGDASSLAAANGGTVTMRAGANVGPSGTPGSLNLTSGRNQAPGGTGGNASFDAGADTSGTGTGGALSLGTANAESVGIGRSGKTTTINGLFALPNDDVQISEGGTSASTEDGAINNIVNGATALTGPAVDDNVPIRDTSGAVGRKMRLDELLKVINALAAEHALAVDDVLLVYDTSAATADKTDVGSLIGYGAQVNCFRLSGASGAPVMTSDNSSISTLYLTPYTGDRISLYDTTNSKWVVRSTSEISKAITGRTANLPFDVFAYWTGSAVDLEFVNWTSVSARATAIARQNGAWVKSGDASRRYVGTVYATSATTTAWVVATDDTQGKAYIFNVDNRVPVVVRVRDTTNSWTYTTATWRQARASTNNQINVMVGVQEASLDCRVNAVASNSSANIGRWAGIGKAVASAATAAVAPDNSSFGTVNTAAAGIDSSMIAMLAHQPAVGLNCYYWSEYSVASGTTTWKGDNNLTDGRYQSGMLAFFLM